MVGHNAVIHCKHIGSGTLIGMGAVLLANADIGEECIIGAGTMITQNKVIQPRSMVYGTPFKFVRALRQEEVDAVHKDILEYEALGQEYKAMQEMMQQK
jgi:carbonic anhydrase/acetyltransferase-like protein (isoleucine patch superfamily)